MRSYVWRVVYEQTKKQPDSVPGSYKDEVVVKEVLISRETAHQALNDVMGSFRLNSEAIVSVQRTSNVEVLP